MISQENQDFKPNQGRETMNKNAIKIFRFGVDITQKEMARRLAIAQTTYSNYENLSHRIPMGILKKLYAMGFNINSIFSEKEPVFIGHSYLRKTIKHRGVKP